MSIVNALRARCGHDSRSVEGCLDCEAADEIERLHRAPAVEPNGDADARAYAAQLFSAKVVALARRFADNELSTYRLAHEVEKLLAAATAVEQREPAPIDMVLHCPACGMQHIDGYEYNSDRQDRYPAFGEDPAISWDNPPHRSHLCHGCGHIWRPADVPTNGVAVVKTRGKADSPAPAQPVERPDAAALVDKVNRLVREYGVAEATGDCVRARKLLDDLDAAIGSLAAATSQAPRAGTPAARFEWIMAELEKRFPDPEPFSASIPEIRYFAALDAALVATPQAQEAPVAWTTEGELAAMQNGYRTYITARSDSAFDRGTTVVPLYTHPAQDVRAPLSDADIREACISVDLALWNEIAGSRLRGFARAVLAKAGVKGRA